MALPETTDQVFTPVEGQTLGERYRIVGTLGAGGMAEVFEVEHLLTRRHLALKILKPEARANPVSVERFFREASVCAGIDSDHIVQMIDCGVDPDTRAPYLVMELLQGKDLAQTLRAARADVATLPHSLVTTILWQAASALDKVHGQGIIHRDLKPANLFLTYTSEGSARVKILDFGIARLITGDQSDDATFGSSAGGLGTPLYMAPEQLFPNAVVSPATDVFALGLIAYELQVGAAYWEGHTAASLARAIPDGDKRPLPSALALTHGITLMSSFDRWLLRCLDPDPRARFQSAGEAIGALLTLHDPRATIAPSVRAARTPAAIRPSTPTHIVVKETEDSSEPEVTVALRRAAVSAPSPIPAPAPPSEDSSATVVCPRPSMDELTREIREPEDDSPTRANEAPTIVRMPTAFEPSPRPVDPVPTPVPAPVMRGPPPVVLVPAAIAVQPPSVAPPAGLSLRVLAAAAITTGALLGAASWVILHNTHPPGAAGTDDTDWRGPSTAEAAALSTASEAWTRAITAHQQPDGSFAAEVAGAPASGWDTGQQLTALLAARSVNVVVPSESILRAVSALRQDRLDDGWAGAPVGGRPPRVSTPATAWAMLAYDGLAGATESQEPRDSARSARDLLLRAQLPNGGFRYVSGAEGVAVPARHATVMALWALVETEKLDAFPSVAAVAARRNAQAWVRRAMATTEAAGDPGAGMSTVPGLAELAVWVLLRANDLSHEESTEDEALAHTLAHQLAARCPVDAPVCTLPREGGTVVRQQATMAETAEVFVPWLPWSVAAGNEVLKHYASVLPAADRDGLARMVRAGIATMVREQAAIAAEGPGRVSDHLLVAARVVR